MQCRKKKQDGNRLAVKVIHRPGLVLHRNLVVDLGHSGREDGQLQLRHSISITRRTARSATFFGIILFSQLNRNFLARSGVLTFRERFAVPVT